jgi:preprotein translocase subunit SecG
MEHVVLVIHLMLALSIIGLVLLQRSEGGGLGIGGGGGMGAFATAGQTANALTRATKYCAAGFFCTSLLLAVLAGTHTQKSSLMDSLDNAPAAIDSPANTGDNELPGAKATGETSKTPSAPISE